MTFPAWVKPSWIPKIIIEDAPHGLDGQCWLWRGARTVDGYGLVRVRGRAFGPTYLHRYGWEQHHGEPLGDHDGGHLCGRQNCFQPTHIEKQSVRFNRSASTAPRFSHGSAQDIIDLADAWWLIGRRHAF